jgi:hypothetical protein
VPLSFGAGLRVDPGQALARIDERERAITALSAFRAQVGEP